MKEVEISDSEIKDKLEKELIAINKKYIKKYKDKNGLTRAFYRQHTKFKESDYINIFNSFRVFKEYVFEKNKINKITRESLNVIKKSKKGKNGKGYFVTAAIAGAKLDVPFFESVQTFCNYNEYELVILPMRGVHSKDEGFPEEILRHKDYFATEFYFNSNLVAYDFNMNPQQIDPLTGLKIYAKKSVLIASPKQRLLTVPNSNFKIPQILLSTGAITIPKYLYSTRGKRSEKDHVRGGIVVEVEDNKIFHLRPVYTASNGSFYDLNKLYSKDKVTPAKISGIVMGDYHTGFEDLTAVQACQECIDLTQPEAIVWNDIYDGCSISHHHERDMEMKVNKPEHLSTLEKELNLVGETLRTWRKKYPRTKFVIVRSNHDEFLDRYLKECRYVYDSVNHVTALELALHLIRDRKNPLQAYIEKNFKIDNIVWLDRNQSYKINGVQVGAHGDIGKNGSRGTLRTLEESYGDCVVAHSHSPEILRKAWRVGTLTLYKLPYIKGPSSWLQSFINIYPSGQKQLIISIDGKWRLKK